MIGFVVNPAAGSGRAARVWQLAEAMLKEHQIDFHACFTAKPGDGRGLALMLAEQGAEVVVAVGGDGTVQEVAHGLTERDDPPLLGYIPAGSGNDFARGNGLPMDPREAVACILNRQSVKQVDVLRLSDRIAVNAIGAGLDGTVAETANRAATKRWGSRIGWSKIAYTLSAIRTLLTYTPCRVRLEIDGRQVEVPDVWMVTVANIPYYGGGMKICPQAVSDDGKADVCVVSGNNRWTLLRVFPQVYRGGHIHHPAVRMYQGSRIRIEAERPLPVHADGEQAGHTPVCAEVAHRRLLLCAPGS